MRSRVARRAFLAVVPCRCHGRAPLSSHFALHAVHRLLQGGLPVRAGIHFQVGEHPMHTFPVQGLVAFANGLEDGVVPLATEKLPQQLFNVRSRRARQRIQVVAAFQR